jgi:hypothetical protein
VLEVNTRRAISREARLADLTEALEFTRKHLGVPAPASPGAVGTGTAGTGTGTAGTAGTGAGTAGVGTDAAGVGTDTIGPAAGPDPDGPRGSVLPASR